MIETKILTFLYDATELPQTPGESTALNINLFPRATTDAIGDGWEPLSHQLTSYDDGTTLISILVRREVRAPDYVE